MESLNTHQTLVVSCDNDLLICPLTYCIMRHPILASDGRHYELSVFYEMINKLGNRSPINRQPITYYIYDQQLKNVLDHAFTHHPDRFEDYDEKKILGLLSQHIKKEKEDVHLHWKTSLVKSIGTAGLIGCASFLLYYKIVLEEHRDGIPLLSFHVGFCSGMIDFLCRIASHHQFGLFGACKRVASGYFQYRLAELEEVEEVEYIEVLNQIV